MLPRLFIALGLASLACLLSLAACSSKQRKDQYYGTDEGKDYRPEAGVFSASSSGNDAGSSSLDAPGVVDSADANRVAASPDSDEAGAFTNSDDPDAAPLSSSSDADPVADDADIDS